MKTKHLRLPENQTFDEKEIAFLEALDRSFDAAFEGKADKKVETELRDEMNKKMAELAQSQKFDLIQNQLNQLFLKLDPLNRPEKNTNQEEDRGLNAKWIRAFFRKNEAHFSSVISEMRSKGFYPPDGDVKFTFDPDAGSALVPELLLAEIYRWVREAGVARREMRYLPMSGAGNERFIPTMLQSLIVGWVDHGGLIAKNQPTSLRVKQHLEKIGVIVPLTEEIVEDDAIDLVSFFAQLIGEAFAVEEDRTFFSGRTSAGDPYNGILSITGTTHVNLSGAQITPDALNNAVYAIPTAARRGGKFFMHPRTFGRIQRFRSDAIAPNDGLGGYLVQQPTGDVPPTLWNFPIILSDELPTFEGATSGQGFMFFANLAKTCVYGDKYGVRIKNLDQASIRIADPPGTLNLAEHGMVAVRGTKRVGYVAVLPQGIAVIRK